MPVTEEERKMVLAMAARHNQNRIRRDHVMEILRDRGKYLERQLVHYQGKFATVKHENNKLRKRNKNLKEKIDAQ